MKYLMLIYGNEKIWNSLPASKIAELIREVDAFNAEAYADHWFEKHLAPEGEAVREAGRRECAAR